MFYNMKEKINIHKKAIIKIISITMLAVLLFVNNSNIVLAIENILVHDLQETKTKNTENEYVYLSDIAYKSATVGWKTIMMDKTTDNTSLCLKLGGSNLVFKKGVFAHASSTIIYDLSAYNYDYFSTYYGVSAHMGGNGSVKFSIYTSIDGTNWNLETEPNPPVMTGRSEAKFIKIDIRGKKYLKLEADSNGNNGQDHSLYADAKLFKEGYNDNVTKPVEEFDELIRTKYEANSKVINDEIELLILQRELVKNAGSYQLRTLFEEGENYKNTFNWLFNDLEMLRLYIMGGTPDGTYMQSFKVLASLYEKYKDDLTATGTAPNGTKLSDVYKTMMISLALSHSRQVDFWITSTLPAGGTAPNPNPNISIATNRYQIYKELLADNKLDSSFEKLRVEEMRYIMNSQINDDEIKWLNSYSETKANAGASPISGYSYMNYINVSPNLYRSPKFYEDDISKYETKYKLTGFDVKNEKYYPRLWMIMEIGGVCWQISNVGQNATVSRGLSSTIVGQPGHSAYLVRKTNSSGKGYWEIWNNVGGWQTVNLSGYSGNRSYYGIRLLNGWGNGSYTSKNPGTYILLGQAAMNDYDNYVKAKENVLLANSYADNKAEQERLYREALRIQNFNLDAWLGLINIYVNDNTKTEEQMYTLAKEVAEALTYYPLPMHDMLNLINAKIKTPAYMANMTSLENRKLNIAKDATASVALQHDVVRIMANYLLGTLDSRIATFSFDGEDANTIVLANRYTSENSTWDYSLDGGKKWTVVDEKTKKLSAEEIASINSSNDIKVHLIGVNYEDENIYTIDITEGTAPVGLYNNDLENKVIGATDVMEWRLKDGEESIGDWKSFSAEHPDLTGNKTIEVRNGATGTKLASNAVEFSFTQDVIDETHLYIPIGDLSVDSFSSETVRPNYSQYEYARNAIDGNLNTHWHSSRVATNDERFIVIKLAEEKYISRLQYVPVPKYNYGVIKDAEISISLDGKEWTKVKDVTGLENNDTIKDIDFEPTRARYLKLKVTNSYERGNYFVSASMLNLFEDSTKIVNPAADLEYSTKEITNNDVTVSLVNPNREITITNNGGNNTYTFTQNGEFTFEFEDEKGLKGTATATVDWIDKEKPVATVEYDINSITNEDVTATISFNEPVTILKDIPGLEEQLDSEEMPTGIYKYKFETNAGFCLEFEDLAGNKQSKEVSVNWIDKDVPTATVWYDTTVPTNQNVVATIRANKEVTILNKDIELTKLENGDFTYTFTDNSSLCIEFKDKAGNIGEVLLQVDIIDKKTPTATIEYSTQKNTSKPVIATIKPNEEVTITNNEGKNTYTFTENGKFTFEFVDKVGNKGTATANVNWIVAEKPEEPEETNKQEIFESNTYKIEKGYIKGIIQTTTFSNFKKNISTNQKLTLKDAQGNVLKDETKLATGMKLTVGNSSYIIVVRGDSDGDGKVTINDLAKLKRHLIKITTLNETELKSADLDNDNKITINDLAIMKLIIIKLAK